MRNDACYRSPEGQRIIQAEARSRLEQWHVPHRTVPMATSFGDTHLLQCGAESPAVLVLPGTNVGSVAMLDGLAQLAAAALVVAADLPGQPGLSDPRTPPGGVRALGRWADEIVAALATPVTVVGHSLGAAVALSMTPSPLVERLVLVNPAGLVAVRPTPRLLAVTIAWLAHPTTSSAARLVRHMSAPASPVDDALVAWMRLVGQHCRPRGAPDPVPDERVREWGATPIQVIAGRHDRFFPVPRIERRARASGIPVAVVEHAGHLVPFETPEALAGLLVAYRPS